MQEQQQPQPQRPRRSVKGVRLISCTPARCRGLFEGERVAVITFYHASQPMQPMALQLHEAQRLLRDLSAILQHFGEPFGTLVPVCPAGDGVGDRDDVEVVEEATAQPSSSAAAKPSTSRRRGSTARPSKRPDCPKGHIQPVEEWRVHRMLKNLKNNDDFLRFLGAAGTDAAAVGGDEETPTSPVSRVQKKRRKR
jgi:hypothetical protein